jgi:tRNA nucleotidyltransferase (CCA-adding enzyme)
MNTIPDKARRVMDLLQNRYNCGEGANSVKALVVGGFVRDSLLGVQSKDIDIEVYNMDLDTIAWALRNEGFKVDAVGKAFGVLKIDNELDISVPRRENKVGVGHRGFNVEPDPNMSVEEAASRRDFTINSMAMDLDGNIIDPHHGQTDLDVRCLRATSPNTFIEDPLRVMRGMQFASRFSMWIHPDTEHLCRQMAPQKSELPKERIWEEWKKWALKGVKPSDGLMIMFYSHWLDPEIKVLYKTPQDPEYHPEGNVFIHTCHVVDAAAEIAEREQLEDNDRLVLMFAALCHDFGKPSTTTFERGRWRAKGHSQAGVEPARAFLERIGAPSGVILEVLPLIQEHLVHAGIDNPSPRAIRRLANRIAPSNINALSRLIEADHSGRPPLPKGNPFLAWVKRANELNVSSSKPQAILLGRHLIEMGMKPGIDMGVVLKRAFQAQLDGDFDNIDNAKEWVKNQGEA